MDIGKFILMMIYGINVYTIMIKKLDMKNIIIGVLIQ